MYTYMYLAKNILTDVGFSFVINIDRFILNYKRIKYNYINCTCFKKLF